MNRIIKGIAGWLRLSSCNSVELVSTEGFDAWPLCVGFRVCADALGWYNLGCVGGGDAVLRVAGAGRERRRGPDGAHGLAEARLSSSR